MAWGIGDIITFNYSKGAQVTDQFPTVLVLHDNWLCHTPRGTKGLTVLPPKTPSTARCMHGLNWKKLTPQDQNYLRAVMNPMLESKLSKKDDEFAQRIELVNHMPGLDIQSPEDFYDRLIRPMIRPNSWEPYRRYRLDKMMGVRTVQTALALAGGNQETGLSKAWKNGIRRLKALRGRRT